MSGRTYPQYVDGGMTVPSEKTPVIKWLFERRYDRATGSVESPVVTLAEVAEAIRATGVALSDKNTANFFKDFVRNVDSSNQNWPGEVWEAGYTGRQVTGDGRCFEFVRPRTGQTTPFVGVLLPGGDPPLHRVESASLPLASRRLGRSDEAWLAQVVVRLRVVETHMAVYSPLAARVRQVDHLQMSVKLAESEVDAVYLAVLEGGEQILISCEAKGRRDDLLESQMVAQVKALYEQRAEELPERVLPMGIKALAPSRIQLVEFAPVTRADAPNLDELEATAHVHYELTPPVPGIGG